MDEAARAEAYKKAKATIRGVIAKLGTLDAQAAAEQHGPGAGEEAVRIHAARMVARLGESAAYRQALALVQDPRHRERCLVCNPQHTQEAG